MDLMFTTFFIFILFIFLMCSVFIIRKRLIKNMGKYFGKDYRISSDKMNTEGFYCSQYIWYIYYITAQEMGFELDLDSDGGPYVLPYDFINSPYLEIVN